jgi:ferredoxin
MASVIDEISAPALSERGRDGRARKAALAAAARVAVTPTTGVSYRSGGAAVIIGPEDAARAAAARLHPQLRCTVVVHGDAGAPAAAKAAFPVVHERVVQVSGHLGQFAVIVSAPPPAGGVNLLQKLGRRDDHVDLVLDLCDPPFLRHELLPFGYFAPGADATRLAAALTEMSEMVGEFEKPRFFHYNPDICAHGESGLTGCTRCLDVCPAFAITSVGGEVGVDPYLCQGAGACATVCPTGAMTYVYPTLADQLERLRALLKAYREAGGVHPVLLLHDAEAGQARLSALAARLPENAIPMALAELGSLGMDAWLAALAYGAAAVALLPTATTPPGVTGAVIEQLMHGGVILEGMGYAASLLRVLPLNDAEALAQLASIAPRPEAAPATFAGIDEKRTVLRLAIEHLHAAAPAPREVVALADGAPFGEVLVNRERCTLCMACVGVCPVGALADGGDLPQLNFIEANCVQCGLCQTACPEDAIGLSPRYLYDPATRRRARVLNEEAPFYCVSCGKPFTTKKMMDRMTQKLDGHWMFRTPEASRRVQMCGDCRVRDLYRAETKRPGGH